MPAPNRYGTSFTETIVASAARTVSGNTAALPGWGAASQIRAQLDVSAAAGTTPTLNVVLEDTLDGGVTWNTIGTFTQKTAVSREVINVAAPFTDTIRVRWTVGGTTPSFTFSLSAYSE